MKNIKNTTSIVLETAQNVNRFDALKRNFEAAYASGGDYSEQLETLSRGFAFSVVAKLLDPQRKTAPEHGTVSKSGLNPVMVKLRRDIARDSALATNTRRNANGATRIAYTADGDAVTETADPHALEAVNALIRESIGDGLDLVQEAAAAILEEAAAHAVNGAEWLDIPYTVRRLSRKVYIRDGEELERKDEETTPAQEVFRAVRRAVADSRAVRLDPRNGYTYIDGEDPETLDRVYYRSGRYAAIGGEDCHGLYTGDRQTMADYNKVMDLLNLTPRQRRIIEYRMRGYGSKAIATALNVTPECIKITVKRIQARCEKIGFTPSMWREMNAGNN